VDPPSLERIVYVVKHYPWPGAVFVIQKVGVTQQRIVNGVDLITIKGIHILGDFGHILGSRMPQSS
jgi:hypothetical protein